MIQRVGYRRSTVEEKSAKSLFARFFVCSFRFHSFSLSRNARWIYEGNYALLSLNYSRPTLFFSLSLRTEWPTTFLRRVLSLIFIILIPFPIAVTGVFSTSLPEFFVRLRRIAHRASSPVQPRWYPYCSQVARVDAGSLESDANFGFRPLLFLVNGAVHLPQWWIEHTILGTIYFPSRTEQNRNTPHRSVYVSAYFS